MNAIEKEEIFIKLIVLDHGGRDPQMYKLSMCLGDVLMDRGSEVKFSAGAAEAGLFISFGGVGEQSGATKIFYPADCADSKSFAGMLAENISADGDPFRGGIALPDENGTPVLSAAKAAGARYAVHIIFGVKIEDSDIYAASRRLCGIIERFGEAEPAAAAEAQLPSFPQGMCVLTHIVKKGEYIYRIAEKYGVPWQSVAAVNKITPPYTIFPGLMLKIPLQMKNGVCSAVHTVRKGESLYLIAQRFDIPWQTIAETNGIPEPYIIHPGQSLFIPLTDGVG